MSAWTGLYWGARLGWVPAEEANNSAVEPFVVVGLLASDLARARSSTTKVFVGLLVTVGFVRIVTWMASSGETPFNSDSRLQPRMGTDESPLGCRRDQE